MSLLSTQTTNPLSTVTSPLAAVNLGTLTSGNVLSLGPSTSSSSGTSPTVLTVNALVGNSTLSGLGYDEVLLLNGLVTINAGMISTPTGTTTLSPPPTGTYYQAVSTPSGQTQIVLSPKTVDVYRFFDSKTGTHFYTADVAERQSVLANRPDLIPEGPNGVGLEAIDPTSGDPNMVAVYRFFDTTHGTHFFTASASERDTVRASRPDLVYEPNESFYEHATQQVGDVPVYRFFDSVLGTHFYTSSAQELAVVQQTRPDLIAEGIGFYAPGKASS